MKDNAVFDMFKGAFDSKEEAIADANYYWSRLTKREQEETVITVAYSDEIPDDISLEDSCDYMWDHLGGYNECLVLELE